MEPRFNSLPVQYISTVAHQHCRTLELSHISTAVLGSIKNFFRHKFSVFVSISEFQSGNIFFSSKFQSRCCSPLNPPWHFIQDISHYTWSARWTHSAHPHPLTRTPTHTYAHTPMHTNIHTHLHSNNVVCTSFMFYYTFFSEIRHYLYRMIKGL